LEPGRREHQKIVILDIAGIPQLVGDAARCHEAVAGLEKECLASPGNPHPSDQEKITFVSARVGMRRHAHSGPKAAFGRQDAPPVSAPDKQTEPTATSK